MALWLAAEAQIVGGALRSVLTHVLSFVAGGVLVALLGILAQSGRDSTATIVLANETAAPLSDLRVYNRTTGGTLVVDQIAPGQAETIQIYVRGEGSYRLMVELPSTEKVEAGYTITEHITSDEIQAENAFY